MTFLLYGYSVELLLSGACRPLHHLQTPESIILLYTYIYIVLLKWEKFSLVDSFYLLSIQNKTKT